MLVALGGYLLLMPKPSTKGLQSKHRRQEVQLLSDIDEAKSRAAAARQVIDRTVWNTPIDKISPLALANVNGYVGKHGLNLIRFQPQRNGSVAKLSQLPFVLTVDGSFPKVMALLDEFRSADRRLAVNLVQIASADQSSSKVTATIGLVAFAKEQAVPTTQAGVTGAKRK
ncbi:MAG: type 4a pilus biogenesis protein PilO [Fimbriimonadaceae bacterium]|nr:type 4a pilus biogenesis protein PilO [Fimbriimonadaceae bacterium]